MNDIWYSHSWSTDLGCFNISCSSIIIYNHKWSDHRGRVGGRPRAPHCDKTRRSCEFHTFRALYSDLSMDLKTCVVLPFLIAINMDQANPHLTILRMIYTTVPNSSASAEQSFLEV